MTDSVTPTSTEKITAEARGLIVQSIDRLRQLTQVSVQADWHMWLGDLSVAEATQAEAWQSWTIAPTNARNHIAWGKGQQVLWLGQRFTVPRSLQHYPLQGLTLRLALTWWAESAQIFVNGTLVQEGDLFDCMTRIVLSSNAQPAEKIDVALRLVSPDHDDGALVLSRCLYEEPLSQSNPEPGFVADELAVLQQYLTVFKPDELTLLAEAVSALDWSTVADRPSFDRSLMELRQRLRPLGDWLKQRSLHLLGHAHLDLAWLWDIDDTWDAAERTFKSVLQLQQEFPELIFCHSTPALYDWVERNRPELFAAIRQQVALDRWEIVAGLWVEPELNLVSGESIARQVLYGQRYVQEKFGKISAIAWLPDSFGFSWQLPQIFTQGGIRYFVTQKLRWNDTNEFPYELFWWRSPDGSTILSYNSSRIGEGIDPIKMTQYASTWEAATGSAKALWLPGVGDHGGGPTRDMLETARRWQQSPFFPTLTFSTASNYLEAIKTQPPANNLSPSPTSPTSPISPTPPLPHLPIWDDELYLEFHRGCYTSHADQKRWNRQCEVLLYQAELFSSLATLATEEPYPQAAIEAAWKQVLFNQFHDILPGSSIPKVFVDANQSWEAAAQTAQELLEKALKAIAAHISLPDPPLPNSYPIVIFNSLNWVRSDVVAISLPHSPSAGQEWQVYDLAGRSLQSQLYIDPSGSAQLLILATEILSIGYQLLWLSQTKATIQSETETQPKSFAAETVAESWTLENEILRAVVDPLTGNLSSVFDKVCQREILSAPGNQLQAFQDSGQYWDAWNIDPNYAQHPLPAPRLQSIEWVARGAIADRLRVIRQLGQSQFTQDYLLEAGSAVLKIVTHVDWQERHVLVKATFPLALQSASATYEIPFGAIERSTQPNTPTEKAKWEVPALQWADLSEPDYGVSILNDCKYGYDSQPSQLRLTLLRGSTWPDPTADLGQHQFTYALYAHQNDWKDAQTVRRGYELNQPLRVMLHEPRQQGDRTALPPSAQFLNVKAENLVLTAFKRSEDNEDQWVLRYYECCGNQAELEFTNNEGLVFAKHLDPKTLQPVDLLEQPDYKSPAQNQQSISISPWKIVTFVAQRCAP